MWDNCRIGETVQSVGHGSSWATFFKRLRNPAFRVSRIRRVVRLSWHGHCLEIRPKLHFDAVIL